MTYLEKHRAEIIDYGRRQRAGKPIGSGRMEKGDDQVIGARQKHKGMSWSPTGSKALGIVKVVELNQQWEQLLSLSRLNHGQPGVQAHPEIVQGATELHHQIADALLPQAHPVFHNATTLDAAVIPHMVRD